MVICSFLRQVFLFPLNTKVSVFPGHFGLAFIENAKQSKLNFIYPHVGCVFKTGIIVVILIQTFASFGE